MNRRATVKDVIMSAKVRNNKGRVPKKILQVPIRKPRRLIVLNKSKSLYDFSMKSNTIHRKELISILAFSKLHNMPYQAAVRLVRKGIIPVEVIGRLSYIDLNKLETLAREQEMDSHTFTMRRAKYSCRRVRGGLC